MRLKAACNDAKYIQATLSIFINKKKKPHHVSSKKKKKKENLTLNTTKHLPYKTIGLQLNEARIYQMEN